MQRWWMKWMAQATDELTYRVWAGQTWLAQSTVEYALVGALVVIAAAVAMTALGTQVSAVFTNITNTLKAAAGS